MSNPNFNFHIQTLNELIVKLSAVLSFSSTCINTGNCKLHFELQSVSSSVLFSPLMIVAAFSH